MNYLAICAIMKNEAPYVREWVEFHRRVGVEHFHIYENDSTDDTLRVLRALGPDVSAFPLPSNQCGGDAPQFAAYRRSLDALRDRSLWVAYIDADEFLHPLIDPDVPTVLRQYESYGGLVVPWRIFGSNGETHYRDESVLRRFTRCAPEADSVNEAIKSIYYMPAVQAFRHQCHGCFTADPHPVDEFGHSVLTANAPHPVPLAKRLVLHHYFCKSWEEWDRKRSRGRADVPGRIRPDSDFHEYDRNEVEDTRILRFLD